MDSLPTNLETRGDLAQLADQPRVLVRRRHTLHKGGKCVVYWMQRAMRIVDNPALDVAIEAGNLLGLPVVVYFQVIPSYPGANLRHYHFLQQGLRDVEQDAAERGVGFVLRRSPENSLVAFLEEVDAALLIGDENPCREPERWRQVLAKRLKLPFWTVDADVVVPSRIFNRSFVLLHHFRPHLKAELPNYLVEPRIDSTAPMETLEKVGELSIGAGYYRWLQQAGPPHWPSGQLHRRDTRRTRAAARVCESGTEGLRGHSQPPGGEGNQPAIALSALWKHRPHHHCAGGRESCGRGQGDG